MWYVSDDHYVECMLIKKMISNIYMFILFCIYDMCYTEKLFSMYNLKFKFQKLFGALKLSTLSSLLEKSFLTLSIYVLVQLEYF